MVLELGESYARAITILGLACICVLIISLQGNIKGKLVQHDCALHSCLTRLQPFLECLLCGVESCPVKPVIKAPGQSLEVRVDPNDSAPSSLPRNPEDGPMFGDGKSPVPLQLLTSMPRNLANES